MEKRNINIDIIKVCASIFVIALHYFLYNDFYNTLINYPSKFYIISIIRNLFLMCVPLFLIITGYLMNRKEFSFNLYKKGIKKVIIPYIILTFITLSAEIWLSKYGIFNIKDIKSYFEDFMDFCIIEYGWYVDLYLGLLLLIPFINKIFTNKKQDLIFVIILLFLTALPTISTCPVFIISFWDKLYPLTYYAIGAYISRHEIKVLLKTLLITFIIMFSIFSTVNVFYVKGDLWDMHIFTTWGGIVNTCNSVLFFLIILKINFNNIPVKVKNLITGIAKLSLGIYLSSYLFDKILYYYFANYVFSTSVKLKSFIIVVPLVFLCSICMAKIADLIQQKLESCVKLKSVN